jgi:hypothetical protein
MMNLWLPDDEIPDQRATRPMIASCGATAHRGIEALWPHHFSASFAVAVIQLKLDDRDVVPGRPRGFYGLIAVN